MLPLFNLVFTVLIVVGCGYKSSLHYTKKYISGKVFADVSIDIKNPEVSVVLKDSLNDIVVGKFDAILSPKEESNTQLYASISNISFSSLQYDDFGYVSLYRANVNITLNIVNQGKIKRFSGSGFYDFSVNGGAVSSDMQRLEAIKGASQKALDNIVSSIIYAGK